MKDLIKRKQKVQSVIKYLLLFSICISTIGCFQKPNSHKFKDERYDILNLVLDKTKFGDVYYKTINKDSEKPIENYLDREVFDSCICSMNNNSFNLDDKEIDFIKKQFKNQKIIDLSKIHFLSKKRLTKRRDKRNTYFISMPILFRNNTMAIYYTLQADGGYFTIVQKDGKKWDIVCSCSAWIE